MFRDGAAGVFSEEGILEISPHAVKYTCRASRSRIHAYCVLNVIADRAKAGRRRCNNAVVRVKPTIFQKRKGHIERYHCSG